MFQASSKHPINIPDGHYLLVCFTSNTLQTQSFDVPDVQREGIIQKINTNLGSTQPSQFETINFGFANRMQTLKQAHLDSRIWMNGWASSLAGGIRALFQFRSLAFAGTLFRR